MNHMKWYFLVLLFSNAFFIGAQSSQEENHTLLYFSLPEKSNQHQNIQDVLYRGGMGDGFSKTSTQELLTGQELSLFNGSEGDGFDQSSETYTLLGNSLRQLFTGGDGDGFTQANNNGVLLQGNSINIYNGSTGDGFAEFKNNGLFLTGILTDLYGGGIGDGFSKKLAESTTLADRLPGIYNGGINDGFATSSFQGFTLQVLPVEWISFEAVKQKSTVMLLWSTASETNNNHFEVERSLDGLTFSKITQVNGAGTIDRKQDYESIDDQPEFGINYYRIKQVDFDGSFSYTDIKSVLFEEDFVVKLYPNPNRNRILNIEIGGLKKTENVQVMVYNISGQLLKAEEIKPNSQLDLSWDWPTGSYWLKLHTGNKTITRSIIIVD